MAPVEKFSPRDTDFHEELIPAVDKVLGNRGVLRTNAGEDEQTLEQYRVYTVGPREEEATAIVLIGNDASESFRIEDKGKDIRPHRLIASGEIINRVIAEIDNIRSDPRQR